MEINDALVTAITKELLKRLYGNSGNVSCCSGGKKPLVIPGDTSCLENGVLAKLEECFNIIRHSGLEADFPDDAKVLVTNLSIQALTRISEGDAGCTSEGAALLWALLRGKKPVIIEEGIQWRQFKGMMTASLASKYASHERAIASYGAVFAKCADVFSVLKGSCCQKAQVNTAIISSSARAGNKKRVINEVELMKLCPASLGSGQSVEIGTKDILTPLAEDYAAKMRITVIRKE